MKTVNMILVERHKDHIDNVIDWVYDVTKKQNKDMGLQFFIETYPRMFKRVLSNDGIALVYNQVINLIIH